MSTFSSVNPLWDFNLPADSLATLPDDDFLAILHNQIAEANNNTNTPSPGFQSYYVPPQVLPRENVIVNNGKSITQLPPTNTPPSLSDSTPSPPGLESSLVDEAAPRVESDLNGWNNSSSDDPRKRKASFTVDAGENDQAYPSQRTHLAEQRKRAYRMCHSLI
jgi:hypothetical protein